MLSPDQGRPEIINLTNVEASIEAGCIHYLALGDRHSVTEVGRTGRVWFSGAPVATDFAEDQPNQALLVELSANRCDVQALQVGGWTFIAEHFDLNGPADLERFQQWLQGLPNKERTIVKVSFAGSINLSTAAQLDQLLDTQADLFASLRKRERLTDISIVPDELDHDSVTLTGYARSAWEELVSAGAEDVEALAALRLFYRLSQQGDPR